jgi:putative endonuclease
MVTTAQQRQALGEYGERVAARHLVAQGLVVLERNWRCEVGELDLVLREGDVLVACEVKTRRSVAFGTPHEAVDPRKLQRLRVLAERFVADRGLRPAGIRIDLVAVLQDGRGSATVEHVRGLV